jgi:hypothetical protein
LYSATFSEDEYAGYDGEDEDYDIRDDYWDQFDDEDEDYEDEDDYDNSYPG